jgi:ubiquinone/menaquinone biosynthesis C-methylase UbiE
LFEANGLDPARITNASGEALPFGDESFDVVYSANVLEHTDNPELVVGESLRVLRRGGLFHMEMPNFLSYFEGHYMIVQPPLVWKWMLPVWVRLFGRDPEFARTP